MLMQNIALSEAQRRVVEHPLALPGVVDAGAGTGKTFTIVERVAALHKSGQCAADKILLLTFARKAAAELRARIARRLGEKTPTCSTFHAFAWSILSARAYDIGLSPETTVIEDAEARVEFRKAFDEFLHEVRAGGCGFPLRTFNLDEIRNGLFAIGQDLKQQGTTVQAFRERAIQAAEEFGRITYRELRRPNKHERGGQGGKVIARVDDGRLMLEVREEKQRVDTSVEILLRFDARLAARHALTYADILARAEAAVRQNQALRNELRERYRCCIVDEYQDTDLAQHRFLEALFGKDLANVMVVGDVLQSIFGFRGAHPENVDLFKTAPQARAYTLVENRRSRQEILDFAHHEAAPAHSDAPHLVADRGPAGKQIVHVASLWAPQPAQYVPWDEARKLEAAAVARRICQLLGCDTLVESGGVRERIAPRHFAILSRTKLNVQPVSDALLAAGVPFLLVGGVGFYDSPEVRDVLAWLRLLADPFDSHAVARALASTAIGASDGMLADVARGIDRDETAFARRVLVEQPPGGDKGAAQARETADKLRELLDKLAPQAALPLLGALRAVLELTGIERHYQASDDPRAEQALANLAKLEALARGFAQDTTGAQPADFVSFIDELERIDFDEREADVRSSDAVTISTIHSAKGLEWPFVFVLGVWPKFANPPRLFVDEPSGALLYGEGPDGSRPFHYQSVWFEADASGVVPHKGENPKEDPEERRLFYVAITRARDCVFVSGLRGKPSQRHHHGKAHPYLEETYEWLRARGWNEDEDVQQEVPRFERARSPRAIEARAPAVEQPTARETALALPLSYSLIARFEQCPRRATYKLMLHLPEVGGVQKMRAVARRADEAPAVEDLAPPDSLLNAGEYGSVLHKALELWALDRRRGNAPRSPATYVIEAAQQLDVLPPKAQQDSAERAMEQITRRLKAWRPEQVEAPFTLDFGDEGRPLLVSGYLDLLARHEGGGPSLLDYKTGDMAADHSLQLALYRAAAREVYAVDVERCFIGQVDGKNFALEAVETVSTEELYRRITAVRDGLLKHDTTPKAGLWCATCGYRAAPCQDYLRSKKQT